MVTRNELEDIRRRASITESVPYVCDETTLTDLRTLIQEVYQLQDVIADTRKILIKGDQEGWSWPYTFKKVIHVLSSYSPSDPCKCFWTEPETWTTHYGAVEPGSQREFNPECPEHGDGLEIYRPRAAPDPSWLKTETIRGTGKEDRPNDF